ncbi:MAG: hypothetical protein QHH30_00815 [candidate division NC10 bacterium]|nr:hypothetical protein [candidate division NC10 bacterium]
MASCTAAALFLCLHLCFAALPDFNRLQILGLSHSIEQGPQADPDPFYPEYLSLSYQIRVKIRIERPPDWDSSLFELPDAVVSYIGKAILDLYQRDGQKLENLASMRVGCELYPVWMTATGEMAEKPSRISYYVPSFLLERGSRGQIDPREMLDRGRAHLRALLRRMRE